MVPEQHLFIRLHEINLPEKDRRNAQGMQEQVLSRMRVFPLYINIHNTERDGEFHRILILSSNYALHVDDGSQ